MPQPQNSLPGRPLHEKAAGRRLLSSTWRRKAASHHTMSQPARAKNTPTQTVCSTWKARAPAHSEARTGMLRCAQQAAMQAGRRRPGMRDGVGGSMPAAATTTQHTMYQTRLASCSRQGLQILLHAARMHTDFPRPHNARTASAQAIPVVPRLLHPWPTACLAAINCAASTVAAASVHGAAPQPAQHGAPAGSMPAQGQHKQQQAAAAAFAALAGWQALLPRARCRWRR